MARHYSTKNMVESLIGLLGTGDLADFEKCFIENMERRLEAGSLTELTEKQITTLESIHNKHFA